MKRWLDCLMGHEPSLYRHSLRVAKFATAYTRFNGCEFNLAWSLTEGALLHDLGKTCLPSALLLKPRALNDAEKKMMMLHPGIGSALLEAEGYYSKIVLKIVKNHHERLDGSGYPSGWRSQRTAKAIRIVAVCDAFCSITEDRPYEEAWPWELAIARLRSMPNQYDPNITEVFHQMLQAGDLTQQILPALEPRSPRKARRHRGRGLPHPVSAFYEARVKSLN